MKQSITYFESYKVLRKKLELKKTEIGLLGKNDADKVQDVQVEIDRYVDKMKEIEQAIENYVPQGVDNRTYMRLSDEQLYLQYRYLLGMTMEQTAEAMYVSRDTVYRIRRRIVGSGNSFDFSQS